MPDAAPPMPDVPGVRHRWLDLPTGVRIHLAEAGDPDAPPVLALHGWPQHWWLWRQLVPQLGGDHRLLMPDLRGLGWSGQPADGDFRAHRLAEDAIALLDELGIARVKLIGHDMGGLVGWFAALTAPERVEAFLCLNIIHPWQKPRRLLVAGRRLWYQAILATPGLGPAVIRTRRPFEYGLAPDTGAEAARIYLAPMAQREVALASSALYRQFWLHGARAMTELGRGRRVELPMHVLFGRHDVALDPRLLRGLRPHAPDATVELCESGHFVVDEQPRLVAQRARELFAG